MFVYIRIPGDIGPIERGDRFEDPIEAKLRRAGIGEVTGGGSLLTEPRSDGSRGIEYCGIDVDLTKPREGIALLLSELPRLRAPKGTVLEFSIDDVDHELDVYESQN